MQPRKRGGGTGSREREQERERGLLEFLNFIRLDQACEGEFARDSLERNPSCSISIRLLFRSSLMSPSFHNESVTTIRILLGS
jgi:hypothetical protein